MIDEEGVRAILAVYSKHGWELKRALLSDTLRRSLGENAASLFPSAELVFGDLDALWFSRSSRPDIETWELRQLSVLPYALDAFLDDEMDASAREEVLKNTEARLRDADRFISEQDGDLSPRGK